ncbi:caspase domain-containing protein [Phascolomyces articulosus]|uniref:Caspase domain-containing protein n=1 Tax=Phascolomyces articulosus TaxID=60185 RepID=A0AAD5PEE1_9FUNG|nr:caspase domain-containing protein [Phascolomyces articulosus]
MYPYGQQPPYPPPPQQYGGYPPPQHPGGYPPPPPQGYPPSQGYPTPPPPAGNYPQQHQGYPPPPPPANTYPGNAPPPAYPPPQGYAPPTTQPPNYRPYPGNERIQPPTYQGQDPVFRPQNQGQYPQQIPNAGGNLGGLVMHVNPSMQNRPPPNFQLSNCQGRKRALLIGINYFRSPNELKGCINDVNNLKSFLMQLYNFRAEDMVILTDDQADQRFIPTRANMIAGMEWLVRDARPNDSFFFHFSGHGGRVKDTNGDEDDGWDETIYPVDHQRYPGKSGQIVDDVMHDIMVRRLPPGARLTAIFDSCHSGTALDLPYVYSTSGALKEANIFKDAGSSLMNAGMSYASGNIGGAISSVMSIGNKLLSGKSVDDRVKQFKSSAADVVMFSGCKDEQTSADAFEAGRSTGAMSHAFTTALRSNPRQSYLQLLNSVRTILREKYSQRPQLSSSHPIDVNTLFIC